MLKNRFHGIPAHTLIIKFLGSVFTDTVSDWVYESFSNNTDSYSTAIKLFLVTVRCIHD